MSTELLMRWSCLQESSPSFHGAPAGGVMNNQLMVPKLERSLGGVLTWKSVICSPASLGGGGRDRVEETVGHRLTLLI